MASDDSGDSLFGVETNEPLMDEFEEAVDNDGGDLKVVADDIPVHQRHLLVRSQGGINISEPQASTSRASGSHITKPSECGGIEAKNKVITSLQQKLQDCKCQSKKMSLRDSYDGRSPPVLSPTLANDPEAVNALATSRHGNAEIGGANSTQYSSEMETSNSTDAEKLATYPGYLEVVKERDTLQVKFSKVMEENSELRQNFDHLRKMHQITLNLKQDNEKALKELEKKYHSAREQLEISTADNGPLKQQLEVEHERLIKAEMENERYRKIELKLKDQLKAIKQEKLHLQDLLEERTAEALSATAYNPGQEAITQLNDTIDILCNELKQAAETVKRQNETIRRIKNKHDTRTVQGDGFSVHVLEEQSVPSFLSRGHSNSNSQNQADSDPGVGYHTEDNLLEDRKVPVAAKSQRGHFMAPTDPSDEVDIYGASTNYALPQQFRRSGGAFDLDSFEQSMTYGKGFQQIFSQSQPLRPVQNPMVTDLPQASHSQPLFPRPPPSRVFPTSHPHPPPVEQADGGEEPKVCPVCKKQQPPDTNMDMFQKHVLDCLEKDDEAEPTARTDSGTDMVCPVCSCLFPPTTPHEEFEGHVHQHFDSEYAIVERTDGFGSPRY